MIRFTFKGVKGSAEPYHNNNKANPKGWYVRYGGMGFHLSDIKGPLHDYLKDLLK